MAIVKMTDKEFRTMQLLELDLITELDRVCRKHDIKYCLTCGSLLGAVRHKGFIPWDDDADIAMLREEYEKFRSVADELNPEICFLQDHFTDPDYLWGYAKLRRKGTTFIRDGQEHLKGKTGVFIDIFVLDDIPLSSIGMAINDLYCCFLRKVLWSRVGKVNEEGIRKIWYLLLSNIKVDWVYNRRKKMTDKSSNQTPNRVRTLLFPSFGTINMKNRHPSSIRYGMPKEWFLKVAEYDFEGHRFFGTKDYDAFLTYMYGDYMTLPPEDKRDPHAPVSSFSFNVEPLTEHFL